MAEVELNNFNEKPPRLNGYIEKHDIQKDFMDVVRTDIAQNRYFTVRIEDVQREVKPFFDQLLFPTPEGKYNQDRFLPVKSINVSTTSYENLSVSIANISDVSLINKRKACTIQLTCYDTDSDKLELALHDWINSCFVNNRSVYLSQIYKSFTYVSYNVEGKPTFDKTYFVVPVGNISISRDYESNNAKMITFNLACVGEVISNR